MKAAQASSNATLLVTMMISMSLRRMERSRKVHMSVLASKPIGDDAPRQGQQLGAELQPGARRRIRVDFKPHPVFIQYETNCPARLRKPVRLADGEHARPFQAL